jgi:hypothetical protein
LSRNKTTIETAARQPVLIMIFGRGRIGKTVVSNTTAQFYRDRGAALQLWDVTGFETPSHSLAGFHPDAETPPCLLPFEIQKWLEKKIEGQIESLHNGQSFDALLDVGSANHLISKLGREVQLMRTLEKAGVRPVALHVIGTDEADVDHLTLMAEAMMPAAMLIVVNDALITNCRSETATIMNNSTIKMAVSRGAKVLRFPKLLPMDQVTGSRLLFSDATAGKVSTTGKSLSQSNRLKVANWWNEAVPDFFGAIDPLWMPSIPPSAA